MTPESAREGGRKSAWGFVRMILGAAQMVGALTTVLVLLQTGMSQLTWACFVVTMILLFTSLLLRRLGCWDEGSGRGPSLGD